MDALIDTLCPWQNFRRAGVFGTKIGTKPKSQCVCLAENQTRKAVRKLNAQFSLSGIHKDACMEFKRCRQ